MKDNGHKDSRDWRIRRPDLWPATILKLGGIGLAFFSFWFIAVAGRTRENSAAGVTYERILNSAREPQNWLTYSGRYSSWRFSALNRINAGNASRLRLAWVFQTAALGQFETTPLEVDGVLYGTAQDDGAFALDARTGRAIWRYRRNRRNLPDKVEPCCGRVNRGFAILGNRLFMATLDAHIVALDAKTGNVLWDTSGG
jgi:alcohol dehydrogenase (cytochrome c)